MSGVSPSRMTIWSPNYDNDGYPDLFVCGGDIGTYNRPSSLFHNNADGTFTKVTNSIVAVDFTSGGFATASAWVDYDNDGFLDLFVTQNSSEFSSGNFVKNFLYQNNGDSTFTKITEGSLVNDLGRSVGCAWGDINSDGFSDLFVSHGYRGPADGTNFLYVNNGNSNAWLSLRLIGTVSNRAAIGAKVRVRTFYRGSVRWQVRELAGGSNDACFNDLRASFGLADATNADLVRIEWPSGTVQELRDVAARQFLTVTEPPLLSSPRITNGMFAFTLKGGRGFQYGIQSSSNAHDWALTGSVTVTNFSGTAVLTEPAAVTATSRHYRAVSP